MTRDRILVIVLALWGLAMIVPDLVRVVYPLGSFGLYANNDGLIYSVSGPFEDRATPAWQAGIRVGDRLDLERLRCRPSDISSCGPAFAVLGGMDFVTTGQEIALPLAATDRPGTTSDPGRHRAPRQFPRPHRQPALPDRRHRCRDCRSLACVDQAVGDELGLLPLR